MRETEDILLPEVSVQVTSKKGLFIVAVVGVEKRRVKVVVGWR